MQPPWKLPSRLTGFPRYSIPNVPDALVQQAEEVIKTNFTPETVLVLLQIIVFKYLRLSDPLLELWDEDPEEFFMEEYAYAYK